MSDVLRIAASVGTPLGLLGLVVALAYFAYARRLKSKEKRLELLPPDERAKRTDEYLTRYGIDGANVRIDDKVALIHDEMAKRHLRSIIFVIIAAIVFLLCFAAAVFRPAEPAPSKITLNGTQDREGSEPSELLLTDLTDDPPPVENMGSEIDNIVKRAERQLFRLPQEPSPNSSSADSPAIEMVDQFDGHLFNENIRKGSRGKAIKFILSNPGDGVLFVDKIWLNVLDRGEFALYSFPVGVRVPSQPIKLEVTLNSNKTDYLLTETHFSLIKGNSPDEFWVQIKSSEALWYRVKVNARWFKVGAPDKKGVAATRDCLVGFPQVRDFKDLLAGAKKLDIQVNALGLKDLRGAPKFKDDSTRILIPGAAYYQPTPPEQLNLLQAGDNVRPTGEGVRWRNPTCSGCDFQRLCHQFIIIDDGLVLCNYQEIYGLIISDPSEVKRFRDCFEANWNYAAIVFENAEDMIADLLDRKVSPKERALAAFNLRHITAPKGIAALAESLCDPSANVRQAARASMDILASSEIVSLKREVAKIVLEKYRKMAPAMNTADSKWMKEYTDRLQMRR